MAKKPNLLLCFDAFGTLFSPSPSVHRQYWKSASRTRGLEGVTSANVSQSLSAAFRAESRRNPNYGKATGLGATQWWTNVIHNTFEPHLKDGQKLEPSLVRSLLMRFSNMSAYRLRSPSLVETLRALKTTQAQQRLYDDVVVGVVTNSDDRVPGILSSAGFKVSPLRFGNEAVAAEATTEPASGTAEESQQYDIDFHCMSYDVGVEKPDRAMFEAAEAMLKRVLATRPNARADDTGRTWEKIYIGDEYNKDVVGALGAGWKPVLLDIKGKMTTPDGNKITNWHDLEPKPSSIAELFNQHKVIGVRHADTIPKWLTNREQQPQ